MRIEKFRGADMSRLMAEKGQLSPAPEALRALESSEYAYTVFSDENRVLACGGLALYWKDRGEVWAALAVNCKRDMLGLHRAALRFLKACPARRVEASVFADDKKAHRWAKLLGFQLEAERLRAFMPDGQDAAMYARVA